MRSNYSCYEDADCIEGFTCNMWNNNCNVPLYIQERLFIQCLLDVMDKSQQLYVKQYFGVTLFSVTSNLYSLPLM
jgi:hypothetical protein